MPPMAADKVRAMLLMLQARLKGFCECEAAKGEPVVARAAEAFEKGLNDEERLIVQRLGIYTLGVGRV